MLMKVVVGDKKIFGWSQWKYVFLFIKTGNKIMSNENWYLSILQHELRKFSTCHCETEANPKKGIWKNFQHFLPTILGAVIWWKLFEIHQAKAGMLSGKRWRWFSRYRLLVLQCWIHFLGWVWQERPRSHAKTCEVWMPGVTSCCWCWKALDFWTLWTHVGAH